MSDREYTECPGECAGTGEVPVYLAKGDAKKTGLLAPDETNMYYRMLWHTAEKDRPSGDGWHVLPCIDCSGSGKRV